MVTLCRKSYLFKHGRVLFFLISITLLTFFLSSRNMHKNPIINIKSLVNIDPLKNNADLIECIRDKSLLSKQK
jgi:hypothetical protein